MATTKDQTAWLPLKQLVDKLHRVYQEAGVPSWAVAPSPALLDDFFDNEAAYLSHDDHAESDESQ